MENIYQFVIGIFFSLIGQAGGLSNLAKMPASNILVLGSQRKTLSGFSSTAIMPHTGFIHFSNIVQATSPVSKY